jgi:hypothetical protein
VIAVGAYIPGATDVKRGRERKERAREEGGKKENPG